MEEPMDAEDIGADSPQAVDLWPPSKRWLKLMGLGAPALWFLLLYGVAAFATPSPHWRAQTWEDRALELQTQRAIVVWAPLILCSLLAMRQFLENPLLVRRNFLWRMAIYTGFVIAAYHWLLFTIVLVGNGGLVYFGLVTTVAVSLGAVAWFCFAAAHLRQSSWPARLLKSLQVLFIRLLLTVAFLTVAVQIWVLCWAILKAETPPGLSALGSFLFGSFFFLALHLTLAIPSAVFASVPTWAAIAYGTTSVYLLRCAWNDTHGQFSLKRIFIVTAWIAMLLSFWRITVMWTFGA